MLVLSLPKGCICLKHYSYRTEQACVGWIKRCIYFHNVRHPSEWALPRSRTAAPSVGSEPLPPVEPSVSNPVCRFAHCVHRSEKILYDNAQLARVYLRAWQVTGKEFFRTITEEILDRVVRERLDPEGGFYSTQDADSEGEEGKFFVWTPDEIRDVLGDEAVPLLQDRGLVNGQAAAYVCRGSVCQAPVEEPEGLRAQLDRR